MVDQLGWLALVAIAVFAAGFVQSAMGFGFAVTALAVMSFFVDIHQANLIVSISSIAPMAFAFFHYRQNVEWIDLIGALAGAALALPLGLVVFKILPGDYLVRGTGVIILLLTLDGLRQRGDPSPVRTRATTMWSCAAGAVSGFLSGAVSIGGPPVAAYVVRQPWSPARMKGFLVGFMIALALYKVAGLVVARLLTWEDVVLPSLIVAPISCVGTWIGVLASRRLNARRFRQIALIMLALISVNMIVRGNPNHAKAKSAVEHSSSHRLADARTACPEVRATVERTTMTLRKRPVS